MRSVSETELQSTRHEGVVHSVKHDEHAVWIKPDSDMRLHRAHMNQVKNAPNAHGCLAKPGDRVSFRVVAGKFGSEVKLLDLDKINVRLPQEEISRVYKIHDRLIFCERIDPNCGCSLFVGRVADFPYLRVGSIIRHTVEQDEQGRGRFYAADVREDKSYEQSQASKNDMEAQAPPEFSGAPSSNHGEGSSAHISGIHRTEN
jgi:hypothetical protein